MKQKKETINYGEQERNNESEDEQEGFLTKKPEPHEYENEIEGNTTKYVSDKRTDIEETIKLTDKS